MIINNIRIIRSVIKILPVLIFLAGWASANAQQTDSLALYLTEAAANNPGLMSKYAIYQAALEKVPQVASLPDPELQFGFFLKKMELMEGYQLADFRVMQMFPWFGSLKAAKDEASKMAIARFQEMVSVKNELWLQVKSAWYDVYKIRKEISFTGQNLEKLKSLERMALARFKAAGTPAPSASGGMAPTAETPQKQSASSMSGSPMGGGGAATDSGGGNMSGTTSSSMGGQSGGGLVGLLKVQMEIADLENRLALQNDQLGTAKIRFNSKLSRKPDSEVYTGDSLADAPLPGSLVLLADSIANNPMIRMYEADREAGTARIEMAKKMGMPMIGIGLNYSLISKFPDVTSEMNGKDMVMPMITATLPIYRKKYNALRKEAEYLRDAADASIKSTSNDLRVSYQQAAQQFRDAERRLDLYRKQADLAEKSISLLTRSFSSAGTDLDEILRMQQQVLDYQYKTIEAGVDRNLAVAALISIISFN